MNIILKKSTIQFVAPPTPGQLVTIDLQMDSNYTPGKRIGANGVIQTSTFELGGISIAYSCEGFDRIVVTNAAKNSSNCQLAFFDSTSSTTGHDGYVVEGSAGSVDSIEVNIPQNANYVRFNANIGTTGVVIADRTIKMRVAAVSE